MHKNSIEAYSEVSHTLSNRQAMVLHVFKTGAITDRQVMYRLGFTDMNAVRPRITKLIELGLLEEVGNTKDSVTGRTVRICRKTLLGGMS